MNTQPKQRAANQSGGVQGKIIGAPKGALEIIHIILSRSRFILSKSRFFSIIKIHTPILMVILLTLIIWWFASLVRIESKAEEYFYFKINHDDLLIHPVDQSLLFLM